MNERTTNLTQLRQRAEAALAKTREEFERPVTEWEGADLPRLIEELRIYQAELELQNQELIESRLSQALALDKYRSLFDFSPLPALLVDERGFIIEKNRAAAELFGIRSHSDIHRFSAIQFVEATQQHLLQRALTFGGQHSPVVIPLALIRSLKHGFVPCDIHVLQQIHESENNRYTLLLLVDKRNEAALKKSESRFDLAMDAAAEGIWDWNLLTGEVYYSPGYAKMLGYEPESLRADVSTWLDLLHPDEKERVLQQASDALRDQGHYALEFRACCKDGNYRWILSRGKVVEYGHDRRPIRAIGTHVDITELREARQNADRLNQLKSAFLANMSHEIRTPLNVILGFSDILRETQLNPTQIDYLDKIDVAGRHLLDIINDILDFSKIEAGMLTLEETDFRLSDLIQELTNLMLPLARDKGLSLEVNLGSTPECLRGDRKRLAQALINYLGNAIKFSDSGSIRLNCELVEDKSSGHLLRFEVTDTGIGIASEVLPKLFNPFHQANNSSTRKYGGTGLGLSINKKIAELMGGEVGVTSMEGKGSTFWFTANLSKSKNAPVSEPKSANAPDQQLIGQYYANKRILVAEDDELNWEVAKLILEDARLVIDHAEDGVQAVEQAKNRKYDLILMDMQMPNMDGVDATKQIRQLPGYDDVPILGFTANAFAEDKLTCLQAGMNDFITKPIDRKNLYQKLLKWFGHTV